MLSLKKKKLHHVIISDINILNKKVRAISQLLPNNLLKTCSCSCSHQNFTALSKIDQMISIISLFSFIFSFISLDRFFVKSFVNQHPRSPRLRCVYDNQVFDDFSSSGDDAARSEGQDLANEFYKQLREREHTPVQDFEPREGENVAEEQNIAQLKRKFTGQRVDREVPPPSAGLFSGKGVSVYSVPSSTISTPRQRMMENESQLVERSRRMMLAQSIVTVTFLVFALFVGFTGGIDGNNWSSVPDSLDTNIEGIDGALPIPVDSSQSIWL